MNEFEELMQKVAEEGCFVDSVHQRPLPAPDQWHVQLRRKSANGENAFSYYPGIGTSWLAALRQAAGNAGVIIGRADTVEEDRPRRRRAAADLLA